MGIEPSAKNMQLALLLPKWADPGQQRCECLSNPSKLSGWQMAVYTFGGFDARPCRLFSCCV